MTGVPRPIRQAVLTRASSVRREVQRYLDPGRVPLGLVTVLSGYGGLGKSQYSILLAGRLSRGELGDPAATVIATAEDDHATTVRPRLEAVQADLDLVRFIHIQADDGEEDGIAIPDDLELVEEAMRVARAKLLIVDPLVAHLPGSIDSHKDQSVRRALTPLYRLAQTLDCGILAVIHLNKSMGLSPLQWISGSGAFGNFGRSVLLLDRDPEDPDGEQGRRRVLAHIKSNAGPEMPSLLYEIVPTELAATADQPQVVTSRLELLGESPHTGRALLAAGSSDEERSALDDAREFLLAELDDEQRHPADELFRAARNQGINDRTLQRARKAIGAKNEKTGFGRGWEWWLPKATSSSGKPAWFHEGVSPQDVSPSGESATVEPAQARPLIPGDDGFLDVVARAHMAGQLTTGEALQREAEHKFILRAEAA